MSFDLGQPPGASIARRIGELGRLPHISVAVCKTGNGRSGVVTKVQGLGP